MRVLALLAVLAIGCGSSESSPTAPTTPVCEGVAATIKASGVVAAGGLVRVKLEPPSGGVRYVDERPSNVVAWNVTAGSASFDAKPIGPGEPTTVRVIVECPKGRGAIDVSFELPAGAPKEGDAVTTRVRDA